MKDHAADPRRMPGDASFLTDPGRPGASVFAVGSGKGGVGKSVLSITLAAALGREGHRVLLLDGCQDRGDLHILLGVRQTAGLDALHSGQAAPEDLVLSIADGLWLLPVGSSAEDVHSLAPTDRARLHLRLTCLFDHFDFVVVDAGSGFESTLRATMGATRFVAVAVPEPASLSHAYALIKLVSLEVPYLPIDVVVNRVESEEQAQEVYERLNLAAWRFLKRGLSYLGAVAEHSGLRRAVCEPGELLLERPADVLAMAKRMAAPRGAPMGENV